MKSWEQFSKNVRLQGRNLLKRLDDFPNSILVTGCQRSGTTLLSRVITNSEGMVNYWFGRDDELDAALILSGHVQHKPMGRYCFQTTYLNQRYYEYFNKKNGHKMIWVLRNPLSVVYSMLYNWKKFALNELFESCGTPYMDENDRIYYKCFGKLGVNRLKKACFAYNGKVSQVFELKKKLLPNTMKIIDYDELVRNKHECLPLIYKHIELPYKSEYANMIHSKSLTKAGKLSKKEQLRIEKICMPIYKKASVLIDISI